MVLETARIQKATRKLRELLKKMPGIPSPREIHTFRTNLRRVETALQVFSLDSGRKGRRTAKTLCPSSASAPARFVTWMC